MIKLDQLALSPYAAVGPDHFSVYEGRCDIAGRVMVGELRPRDEDEPVGRGQGDHPQPGAHQHQDGRPPEEAPGGNSLSWFSSLMCIFSHLSSKMLSQSAITVELQKFTNISLTSTST